MKNILAIILLLISVALCYISYKAATKEIIVFKGSNMYSYKPFTYDKKVTTEEDQEISSALEAYTDIYATDQQKAAIKEEKKKTEEFNNKVESEVAKYEGYTLFSASGAIFCIVFSLIILLKKKEPKITTIKVDTKSN